MDISMRLLATELRNTFSRSRFKSTADHDWISSTYFFVDFGKCVEGSAYIVQEEFSEREIHAFLSSPDGQKSASSRLAFIYPTQPSELLLDSTEWDFIWSEDSISSVQTMNDAQTVFDKYNSWENELFRIVSDKAGIDALLKYGSDMVKNDLVLVDHNHRIISSKIYKNMRKTKQQIKDLTKGSIASLEIRNDRIRKFDTEKGMFFPPELHLDYIEPWDMKIVQITMYLSEFARLHLILESNFQEVSESDFPPMRALGKCVKLICSDLERSYQAGKNLMLHHMLVELLNGKKVDRNQLYKEFSFLGWHENENRYIAACFDHSALRGAEVLTAYKPQLSICNQLLERFRCVALPFSGYIFVVFCLLQLPPDNYSSVMARLNSFMPRDLYCGLSDIFEDLHEIGGYYNQAKYALLSQEEDSRKPIVTYPDSIIDVTTSCIAEHIAPKYFTAGDLVSLIEHDNAYKTNLYETLRTYLENNCSVTAASRVLFMQRNGVIYRLKKIESILKSYDLDNPDDRLKLLLCIKVVDRYLDTAPVI